MLNVKGFNASDQTLMVETQLFLNNNQVPGMFEYISTYYFIADLSEQSGICYDILLCTNAVIVQKIRLHHGSH